MACAVALPLLGQASHAPKKDSGNADLNAILSRMDSASAKFKSVQADFVWEQYQKVVDEKDEQSGTIYFVRDASKTKMAADIKKPSEKYLVYKDSKIRLYQPGIDQVTEYETGKHKAEVESFLVLGFGGRGHDLLNAFQVSMDGLEVVNGTPVARLTLVPREERVHSMFAKIIIWVDPDRDVSVKQQFLEPSGDYRTATYNNMKLNQKISGDVFKIKTTGNTKVVKQ